MLGVVSCKYWDTEVIYNWNGVKSALDSYMQSVTGSGFSPAAGQKTNGTLVQNVHNLNPGVDSIFSLFNRRHTQNDADGFYV